MERIPPTLVIYFILAVAAGVVWIFLGIRWRRGKAVLPKEPQRQVVWSGIDLLAILLLFFVAEIAAGWFIQFHWGTQDAKPKASETVEANGQQETIISSQSEERATDDKNNKATSDHPLVVLLRQSDDWKTLLLCSLMAIVIAPLVEEFLFRLLLLGWIESLQEKLRGKWLGVVRRTRGMLPIVVTSLLFALMHSRASSAPGDPDVIERMVVAKAIAKIFALGIAVWFLRRGLRATWEDMGFSTRNFFSDLRLGFITFLATAGPIYLIHLAARYLVPQEFAPDPIPLFFLAIILGFLYHRTQRITAPIVVHAMVNLVAMTMIWFKVYGSS